ncbi:MAG: hypothetical protein J7K77_00940 [Dehalococcoidales bacterium]|nr:hypothetical protein [Dehalococcoidales bacterium]
MARENKAKPPAQEPTLDIENIKRQLKMMDQRLDSIDSTISAVVERVMSQPVTINLTCPHCGKDIEISIMGNKKPSR